MLVSPCKKCGCTEDRKVCSQRCQLLAEYREALGNPFLRLQSLGVPMPTRKLPVPRYVVEQEDYYH